MLILGTLIIFIKAWKLFIILESAKKEGKEV